MRNPSKKDYSFTSSRIKDPVSSVTEFVGLLAVCCLYSCQ